MELLELELEVEAVGATVGAPVGAPVGDAEGAAEGEAEGASETVPFLVPLVDLVGAMVGALEPFPPFCKRRVTPAWLLVSSIMPALVATAIKKATRIVALYIILEIVCRCVLKFVCVGSFSKSKLCAGSECEEMWGNVPQRIKKTRKPWMIVLNSCL